MKDRFTARQNRPTNTYSCVLQGDLKRAMPQPGRAGHLRLTVFKPAVTVAQKPSLHEDTSILQTHKVVLPVNIGMRMG